MRREPEPWRGKILPVREHLFETCHNLEPLIGPAVDFALRKIRPLEGNYSLRSPCGPHCVRYFATLRSYSGGILLQERSFDRDTRLKRIIAVDPPLLQWLRGEVSSSLLAAIG